MEKTIFFNAHHSPIGAFASFTLGCEGAKGGLGLELGGPANQSVYIGIEDKDNHGHYNALPFYEGANSDRDRYDVTKNEESTHQKDILQSFEKPVISRDFHVSTDIWSAQDLCFRIISPCMSIPDPEQASTDELMKVLVPAVFCELSIDNRSCEHERKAFFGFQGNDRYTSMRRLDDTTEGKIVGIGQGRHTAICTFDEYTQSGLGFTLQDILKVTEPENLKFGLGGVGVILMTVPPKEFRTFRFAVCFYRDGIATAGLDTTYYYTRYFKNIESVASFALDNFDFYLSKAYLFDKKIDSSKLSSDQKFMLNHAIRSYYGSTELLQYNNKPFWVVNEGEYRMMNTFDLTVDQLFFEMKMNPWTVRNVLDMFVKRYSYTDKVRFPRVENEYPGGISFTHDMGMANTISRPHFSTYELFGLSGCFSHMTHEQLVNWVLCALVYYEQTQDHVWLKDNFQVLIDCFRSMVNRDNPYPLKRNGIMGLDSTRVKKGAEITTYDSLDVSLGQARNNIYLAVKCFSAYIGFNRLFTAKELPELASESLNQANACAKTLQENVTENGYIPAVLFEKNDSKIIPVIEGLVFPFFTGCKYVLDINGPFGDFIKIIRKHLDTVLKKGICLFDDNGWKISSTSDNSWLSKIYLCQFVARKILGIPLDEQMHLADKAHVDWLLHPENVYFCWSDQMVKGIAKGSKYYPRGVTAILWLDE